MQDRFYKGYKKIEGTSKEINEYIENVENSNYDGWYTNEYLVIKNIDEGGKESELRFDGEKFVGLKLPPSKFVKGRNSLQRCALDMLNNNDITICAILGNYGSGKTALCCKMALYNVMEKGNQSKILGVHSGTSEGHQVGYLKGDFESKTERFFLPIVQQLDGGEYEYERLQSREIIESNIIFYMKGCTYPSTILLLDEAEDTTEKELKLVGTRVGEGGRIFLAGDYKQSVVNATVDNSLCKMCNELKGNPMFGCIYLEEDVRSETSKLFAGLFLS